MADLWSLADLATPWCIHVAATLRIADHMANGLSRIGDLAEASRADAPSLERVLRHLVGRGVFEETETGCFALNHAARGLLEPGARLGFDLDGFGGRMAYSWSGLLDAVRTGRPAYDKIFGRPFWDDLDANPTLGAAFDDLMGPGHGTPDPDVLPDRERWPEIHTVVDIGGGNGYLLTEVLRAHPHARGTLVDLPRAVSRSADVFALGDVADRATAIAQSFFDPLPAGADLYLMKSVLGDWPDEEALRLLTRCREAMTAESRLVLVNGVTSAERADPDLLMIVLTGGKDRTLPEFEALARRAGLRVSDTRRTESRRFLVECRLA